MRYISLQTGRTVTVKSELEEVREGIFRSPKGNVYARSFVADGNLQLSPEWATAFIEDAS